MAEFSKYLNTRVQLATQIHTSQKKARDQAYTYSIYGFQTETLGSLVYFSSNIDPVIALNFFTIHDNPPNIANNLIGGEYIIPISILRIKFNCVSLY